MSTRGTAPALGFGDVLITGLARDGGLYLPEAWPSLPAVEPALAYAEYAARFMWPFVEDSMERDELDALVADAYATFDAPDVCPLRPLGDDGTWLLELFHGPTLAFKDVALQVVGRMFERELERRDEWVTIVVATSGDTGSAAIEACRGRSRIRIVVLHPFERISEVQRRQMTTVPDANVHNLAVEGTFDDCQRLVKDMFGDVPFRDKARLSAMNSINWARVLPQVVYHVVAAAQVAPQGGDLAITVPTGNFSNVYSAYAAHRMGLPVSQLVIATNANDILTRFVQSGLMEVSAVVPTISPAMDIQVSSNFERLLFDLEDRNGAVVTEQMASFRAHGVLEVAPERMDRMRALFDAARVDDDRAVAEIASVWRQHGVLVDPHTAVGLAAARERRRDRDVPMVVAATAHPAKFPEPVEAATGVRPELPERLADLMQRPERMEVVPDDLEAVEDAIAAVMP